MTRARQPGQDLDRELPEKAVESAEPAPEATQPERRRPYARTFEQRRSKVLATAWDMLAGDGYDSFSLHRLSKQSGVALRTIYNAFDDRQGVIAQTLSAHHASLFGDIGFGPNDSRTLVEAVEMCRRVAVETALVLPVASASVRSYFLADWTKPAATSLAALPMSIVSAWLRSAEVDRQAVDIFGETLLKQGFADSQWALVGRWVSGAISEDELTLYQTRTMIGVGLAFGNEAGRDTANHLLRAAL